MSITIYNIYGWQPKAAKNNFDIIVTFSSSLTNKMTITSLWVTNSVLWEKAFSTFMSATVETNNNNCISIFNCVWGHICPVTSLRLDQMLWKFMFVKVTIFRGGGAGLIFQKYRTSTILPCDSAHYAHTDLSCITTELWEILVHFTDGGRNNFTCDKIAILFWRNHFFQS